MLANLREDDLSLFISFLPPAQKADIHLPNTTNPQTQKPYPLEDSITSIPLQVVIPSFMISELRRAFEIGFLLFIPFLVIDLTVASILMSMGMMMLPPVTISLPFKIIFFVLVDGWHLLTGDAGGLIQTASLMLNPPATAALLRCSLYLAKYIY